MRDHGASRETSFTLSITSTFRVSMSQHLLVIPFAAAFSSAAAFSWESTEELGRAKPEMGFTSLLVVALMPVLKTLLVTAVGLFLALEKINILNATARHHVNNLVFYVFTPALVGSNLAGTVTMSSLIKLWFLPVNTLLTFIIGSAFGWILVKITKAPQHLHGLVIGCCAAGNLGNLLLIIIPAVCEEKDSPFGDASTCSKDGEAYASLSMAIGAVFIWTYVFNIMRVYSMRTLDSTISLISSRQSSAIMSENGFEEALLSKESLRDDDIHQIQESLQSNYSIHDDNVKVPLLEKIKQLLKVLSTKLNLKKLFAPTTIATIVGLVIGAVSPLRKLIVGDNATLRVLYSSAVMLGDASIPGMTIIVGANLLKGLKKTGVSPWIIIGVQVVRYVGMPLLGVLVVKGAAYAGLVGSDSLYRFVLLLQYALPSAMSIGTITQLFEVGETDCSVIMLWNYAVTSFALTLWATYYMWIVS